MATTNGGLPTGWPVRCPECESLSFYYVTERSGESRRYSCKDCGAVYIAVWKGKPVGSCLTEPTNTRMEDWDWLKVSRKESEGVNNHD